MLRIIDNVSNTIQGELIDGLDGHEKNYVQQNKQQMKLSQDMWNKLQQEKIYLQQAKDEYFVQMGNFTAAKKKVDEKNAKK